MSDAIKEDELAVLSAIDDRSVHEQIFYARGLRLELARTVNVALRLEQRITREITQLYRAMIPAYETRLRDTQRKLARERGWS